MTTSINYTGMHMSMPNCQCQNRSTLKTTCWFKQHAWYACMFNGARVRTL